MLMHDTTQRVCEHPHGRREIFSRWAYGEKRKVRSVPRPRREQTEPEAREGFLGEKPSDTMFEAFYKTAMSVRAPSRAPGSEALPRRTRAAPTTKYTRTPSNESDRDRPVPRLLSSAQRSSVYVAVVIAGALVGEKVRQPPAGSRSDLPSPWTRRGRLPRYSLAGAIHQRKKKVAARRLRASRRSFR